MPPPPEEMRPARATLVRGLSAAFLVTLLALAGVSVRDEWSRVTARPWEARTRALFASFAERVDAVDDGRTLTKTLAMITRHVPADGSVICVFHGDEAGYFWFFRAQALAYPRHLLAWVIELKPDFDRDILPELKRPGAPLFVADSTAAVSFPRSALFEEVERTPDLAFWRSRGSAK